MDEMKFRQALEMLRAIEQELPSNGDIKEAYVDLYHKTLADIQSATGLDLSYYAIRQPSHHTAGTTPYRFYSARLMLLLRFAFASIPQAV